MPDSDCVHRSVNDHASAEAEAESEAGRTAGSRRPSGPSRRELLTGLAAAGLAGSGAHLASASQPRGQDVARSPIGEHSAAPTRISPNATVLFQGDSITDAGRRRDSAAPANDQTALGRGYAWLAAAGLLVAPNGETRKIHNRGISGNKVHQLAARWDADCLSIKPDVLSILIGVNDIWHARNGNYDGTVEVYERDYDALLTRTRAALPDVRLVICEPFVLRCGAVNDSWFPEFDTYRAAARRVATEHQAVWVPFHSMFESASRVAPPQHWAGDGVHPSADGAALMAQAWLRAVGGG
ncbi:MAG: SGNH/GDSL hydrolase family protein [Phycisphaerales bacterium]